MEGVKLFLQSKERLKAKKKRSAAFAVVILAAIFFLIVLPTGFEQEENYRNVERVKAKVLEVDDTNVFATGVLKLGEQILTLEVKGGQNKGLILDNCFNGLTGKMETDKFFAPGDTALLTIKYDQTGSGILYTTVVDHYRLNVEIILAIIFAGTLILLSGWIGVKAVLSFLFTVLAIWKVLLPCVLKGFPPVLITLLTLMILTFVIIFLVAGFTKKGTAAFLGSALGILATCLFSVLFGNRFMVDASVMPFAEAILYSGYVKIDMRDLLYSAVFLASSGAVMDIAMDIASALDEIKEKKPDIKAGELFLSGMSVSRAVVGTMTTTLLLAYTGSYMTTMMSFLAKGAPILNVLNTRYVSSEILTTLVGSFGLVLVAPFTSAVCAYLYCRNGSPVSGKTETDQMCSVSE